MGYVDRQHAQLLRKARQTEAEDPKFRELRAASQALAWVIDPDVVASPLEMIEGRAESTISIHSEKEDCLSSSHQASS